MAPGARGRVGNDAGDRLRCHLRYGRTTDAAERFQRFAVRGGRRKDAVLRLDDADRGRRCFQLSHAGARFHLLDLDANQILRVEGDTFTRAKD